jgi:hypothetical protein
MLSFKFLAGSCLTLLVACAGATAQDTQPVPRGAPKALRLRQMQPGDGTVLLQGPRPREGGPRLGVTVDQTPDGLKVKEVEDGSLAASAGVKADDVLLRIGEARVHAVDDVALALHAFAPGAEVEVTVIRPGEGLVTLKGTLPEPKAPEHAMADGMKGGFLGVQMQGDDARGDCGGVAVAGVVPDSAAWFAGLEEGDCLLAIDGKELASAEDLAGAVASREPGSLVELRYRRAGQEQSTHVRLGHRGPAGLLGFGGAGDMGGALGPGVFQLALPRDGDMEFDRDFDGDALGLPELHKFLGNIHGDGAHSVEVQIEDDHMTVTKDGVVEHYTRDADGNWIRQDGDQPAPQESQDT